MYRKMGHIGGEAFPALAQKNSNMHRHEFIPAVCEKNSKAKALGTGEATTEMGLYEDEYDLKRQHDFFEHEMSKQRRLAGEFTKAYYHDNGEAVDEFGMKLTSSQ